MRPLQRGIVLCCWECGTLSNWHFLCPGLFLAFAVCVWIVLHPARRVCLHCVYTMRGGNARGIPLYLDRQPLLYKLHWRAGSCVLCVCILVPMALRRWICGSDVHNVPAWFLVFGRRLESMSSA